VNVAKPTPLLINEGVYADDRRKLRSYWTEVHQFTAVKAPIGIATFLSVSECHSNE